MCGGGSLWSEGYPRCWKRGEERQESDGVANIALNEEWRSCGRDGPDCESRERLPGEVQTPSRDLTALQELVRQRSEGREDAKQNTAWKLAEETERDRPEAVRRPGEGGSMETKECVSFRKQNRTSCSKSFQVSIPARCQQRRGLTRVRWIQ